VNAPNCTLTRAVCFLAGPLEEVSRTLTGDNMDYGVDPEAREKRSVCQRVETLFVEKCLPPDVRWPFLGTGSRHESNLTLALCQTSWGSCQSMHALPAFCI
jgi:hypothetical protein